MLVSIQLLNISYPQNEENDIEWNYTRLEGMLNFRVKIILLERRK